MPTDLGSGEQFLPLRDGRTLAYAEAGNLSSKTVVLHMHGLFAVGDASLTSPGNTSAPPPSTLYHDCITSDMTALLSHLYPDSNDSDLKLYISGGSFGTVPVQILYGASYDKFPFGRCILGTYYIVIGPVSRYIPFNLVARVIKFLLARQRKNIEAVEASLWEHFERMDQAEREMFARWCERYEKAPEDKVRNMAENIVNSTSKSWEGFMLLAPLLHSDWGFRPDALDEEHSRPRVLLTASKDDVICPMDYAHYLAANYKNARMKDIHGRHLTIVYQMDEVWAEFLADEQ
ncbi:hypothetical protein DFH29DRAFT_1039150 [Suillus ampliporus]|nr:hypothetical protein DFH29DRAFT_1039150 [Suillus ampliporus]